MKKLHALKAKTVTPIRERNLITILLIIVFAIQFFVLVYFNFKMIENHMGYDSSWSYLKAALMWREKSLNSDVWVDQTSVFFDSSMLLASLVYGLTGKLFFSYGLANIIVLCFSLLCMKSILDLMGITVDRARWFSYNLMICPYLTNGFDIGNDLGYFNDMLSGPAFYSLRALIVMLIVREYLWIKQNKRIGWIGYITLLLCTLAGSSSGVFIIVMILLPVIVFIFEEVLLENSYKPLIDIEAIYAYLGIIFVIIGKTFATHILRISAIDTTRSWTPLSKLFTNFGAPFQGLMKLLEVLPVTNTEISILSDEGIYRLFPLVIFFIIILSIGYAIKAVRKDTHDSYTVLFLLTIILINYLVFGLFNTQYGAALFEERYLISTFMICIMLVANLIQNIKKEFIYSKLLVCLLLLCLVANNYISDKKYIETTNESWQMSDISKVIESQDAELIYLWGDELRTLGRSLRVYDLNHVYKCINNAGGFHHWGDYKYFEDNAEYDGSTLLIISNGSKIVPQNIANKYELVKKLNYVSIYECESNPLDFISGITNDISADFPSTPGMYTQYGEFEGSSFVSNGTEGHVMFGPYCATKNGTYDFLLEYEVKEGTGGYFDVVIDKGTVQLGMKELDPLEKSLVIQDVSLEEGHVLEYRVFANKGTKIKVKKVTIIKK